MVMEKFYPGICHLSYSMFNATPSPRSIHYDHLLLHWWSGLGKESKVKFSFLA
jgi:hypothetical protein